MPGHVFLSYSRTDRSYVDRLAGYLTGAGIPVWYDYEISAGDTFGPRIQQAIDGCAAFVAVLTPAAVASKWVTREIGYADALNKPVLPLLLEDCVKPIEIHLVQHEDVRGPTMPSARFLDRLRALGAGDPATAGPDATDDVARREHRVTLARPNDRLRAVAWSPDARWVATGGDDNRVALYSIDENGPPGFALVGHENWVMAIAWSPDGAQLASASGDGNVLVWDAITGARVRRLAHGGWVSWVDWPVAGIVTCSVGGSVTRWPAAPAAPVELLSVPSGGAICAVTSPDGRRLACALTDRTIRLLADSGHPERRLAGHTGTVRSLAWSPGGTSLASASDDGTVRLWAPDTGTCLTTVDLDGPARSVSWSVSDLIAVTHDDGTVELFDPEHSDVRDRLVGYDGLAAVAWSPDGRRFATAGTELVVTTPGWATD